MKVACGYELLYLHTLHSVCFSALEDHVIDVFTEDVGLEARHRALRAEDDALLATDSAK